MHIDGGIDMRKLILGCSLIVLAGIISGCGERFEETANYYYPEWTTAGKIICLKSVSRSKFNLVNSKIADDHFNYISAMNTDGTTGIQLFSLINDDLPVSNFVFNPAKELLAYFSDIAGGLGNKIIVRSAPTVTTYTGPEIVELDFLNLRSLDWDNTGGKLVYCNSSGEIHVVTLDGLTDTTIAASQKAQEVAWRYGNRIAYVSEADRLYLISSAGTNEVNTGVTLVSQIEIAGNNSNLVYAQKGTAYIKIDVTNTAAVTETVIISSFSGSGPRLSVAGDKVLYYQDGLWLYDIATGTNTRVK